MSFGDGPSYEGPFCVLSIVDNRTFKRLFYHVLDRDPTLPGNAGVGNAADRAVKALRDFIASGFDNPYKLRNDPRLEPLRKRDATIFRSWSKIWKPGCRPGRKIQPGAFRFEERNGGISTSLPRLTTWLTRALFGTMTVALPRSLAMPLLDHFHPPLSRTHPWRGFHGAWAAAVARLLNGGVLPPG